MRGEAFAEGLIGVDVGQLAGGLQFAGSLIDDLGQGVLKGFEVGGGEDAGFEEEALAVEVGEFVWCEAHGRGSGWWQQVSLVELYCARRGWRKFAQ